MTEEPDRTEDVEPTGEETEATAAEAAAAGADAPAADAVEEAAPKPRRRRRKAAAPQAEAAAAEPEADQAAPGSEGAEEAEEPAAEEPAAEEPAAEEPEAEQEPAAEEPEAEEEPAAGEPVAEEASAEPARPARQAGPTPSRRRARRDPDAPVPVVRAQAKYVRSSARKARLVCDHIRGKSVEEARAILALTPRAIAQDWSKLLESAVANAEHNHELVGEDLYVKAVHADEGPTIKRFRPRAMGRATRIRKRTSHLTILLTPKD
jgi:ribosomal protein L22